MLIKVTNHRVADLVFGFLDYIFAS